MIDDWQHVPPFGLLGRIADFLVLNRDLTRLLMTRNAALKVDAEASAKDGPRGGG